MEASMEASMTLRGARVALGPEETARLDIEIRAGKIAALRPSGSALRASRGAELDLEGCLVLPGLINAHDHLEFALFPRLGRGPYSNAAAWANDIYRPKEWPVREHLKVPKPTRLWWGGLRNLLAGVTTVCHHNPYHCVFGRGFPVRVVRRFGWAHSLDFSPDLAKRFRATPAAWPFVVHASEGVDQAARREILRLEEAGALSERTVLVHAVAIDQAGMKLVKRRGASLVWCPSSNQFLFGATIGQDVLGNGVAVALGTDSPLTAAGDLLNELHAAGKLRRVSAADLFRMVTIDAARVLRLGHGAGTIVTGGVADLAVFDDHGKAPASALANPKGEGPQMVIAGGAIKLLSARLAKRHPRLRRGLQPVNVEGRGEFFVAADVATLYRDAAQVLGPEISLGGKRVSP
jgi:cytosine/adenosine deaminase-related metal-dependent hydrolase